MSLWELETRTCPDCAQSFECYAICLDRVPCDECGGKRYDKRMADANEGRSYTVEEIGGACPTQATGRTSDDRPFYFRARHGYWTLERGEPGWPTDYCDWPATRHDGIDSLVADGDDPSNGWMEDVEVLAILDAHFGESA